MEFAILLLIVLGVAILAALFCIFRTSFAVSDILKKLEDIEIQLRVIKANSAVAKSPSSAPLEKKTPVPPAAETIAPLQVKTEIPVPRIFVQKVEAPLPCKVEKKLDISPVPPVIVKVPEPEEKKEKSEFERRASEIIDGIWSWIICGDVSPKENVSKEYAIATTWLVRVAVITIVTGIVFLLKYSIERNLISYELRVFMGILAGLVMLGSGLYIVKGKYRPMALGLCGGGLAIFYFSIYAAASMYNLIGMIPAFCLMALVTAAAGLLAVRLNAILIALIGLCGGYLTPILLNTGVKNLEGLYSYLLLLGAGTIYVARHRDWKLLNFLSFIFTYLLFFVSLNKFYSQSVDFITVISFLTAFFLLFSTQTLIFNIMNKLKSTAIELVMLSLNTAIFLGSAYKLVNDMYPGRYAAVVTVFLALFYVAQIIVFMRKHLNDRKLLITLCGFAGFAIMLTPPILLSGEYITASWALMALAFLWMGKKLDSRFVSALAYVLYIIATARFIFCDFDKDFVFTRTGYFQGLLDRLCSMGVLIFSYAASWKVLCGKVRAASVNFRDNDLDLRIEDDRMAKVLAGVSLFLLFVFLEFEAWHWASWFYPAVKPALMSSVITAAAFVSFILARKSGLKWLSNLVVVLAFILAGKIILADVMNVWHLSSRNFRYVTDYTVETLLIRLFDIVPAIVLSWICFRFSRKDDQDFRNVFGAVFIISLFFFLTFEINTCLGVFLPKFAQGGVSILWGIYALTLLSFGVLKTRKALRYAGLALFAVTAVKVFMVDLSTLLQLYRIIAVVIVGIVLLGGAFVYIRFKDYFENLSGKVSGKDSEKCAE